MKQPSRRTRLTLTAGLACALTAALGGGPASSALTGTAADAAPAALAAAPDTAAAAALNAPITGPDQFYMGVSSHEGTQNTNNNDGSWTRRGGVSMAQVAITELGADSLRDEVFWDFVSSTSAATRQKATDALNRLQAVHQNGGKLLLILDFNSRHVDWGFPHTTEQFQRFLEYATEVITAYGPENLAGVEIWNEWDLYMAWKYSEAERAAGVKHEWATTCPLDSTQSLACPVTYAQLVEAIAPSLHAQFPGLPVIVGVTSAYDPQWTRPMLQYLRDHHVAVDGYSTHPYVPINAVNGCGAPGGDKSWPEKSAECLVNAKAQIEQWYGQPLPVWSTEIGFSTGSGLIDTAQQARLLVETYVKERAVGGIRGIYWYDLVDDYLANNPNENNFGLVSRVGDYSQNTAGANKPSGWAYTALANFWRPCTTVTGATTYNSVYTLTCTGGTRHILLDATLGQLREAQARGWTLVDLLDARTAAIAPGTTIPAGWAGRPVGLYGGAEISFQVTFTGQAYTGQTMTAQTAIGGIQEWRWSYVADDGTVTAATGNTNQYVVTSADTFRSGWGRGPRIVAQAVKDGEVVAEGWFRPTFRAQEGSVAQSDVGTNNGTLTVAGNTWAIDWTHPTQSGKLFITIGGACGTAGAQAFGPYQANVDWLGPQATDYPQFRGGRYGFNLTIQTGLSGQQPVYFYPVASNWNWTGSNCPGAATTTLGSGNGRTYDFGQAPVNLSLAQPVVSGPAVVGGRLVSDVVFTPADAAVVYRWYRGSAL
ncbi:MAG: hypothetical protein LBR19_04870, partial [Bifidobacteriaceae bacterium]|nr:hypothetical protein [Bifidobacteriaceae bacterium]